MLYGAVMIKNNNRALKCFSFTEIEFLEKEPYFLSTFYYENHQIRRKVERLADSKLNIHPLD
jgi:hypothetical protein